MAALRLARRMKMRILRVAAGAAAALALGVAAARAQPLTVVEVNAPAVNCIFHPACTITVSDTVGFIPLPYLAAPNTAFLQSRTFSGAPGTPAAGRAGYMYRISLTQAGGQRRLPGRAGAQFRSRAPAESYILLKNGSRKSNGSVDHSLSMSSTMTLSFKILPEK